MSRGAQVVERMLDAGACGNGGGEGRGVQGVVHRAARRRNPKERSGLYPARRGSRLPRWSAGWRRGRRGRRTARRLGRGCDRRSRPLDDGRGRARRPGRRRSARARKARCGRLAVGLAQADEACRDDAAWVRLVVGWACSSKLASCTASRTAWPRPVPRARRLSPLADDDDALAASLVRRSRRRPGRDGFWRALPRSNGARTRRLRSCARGALRRQCLSAQAGEEAPGDVLGLVGLVWPEQGRRVAPAEAGGNRRRAAPGPGDVNAACRRSRRWPRGRCRR